MVMPYIIPVTMSTPQNSPQSTKPDNLEIVFETIKARLDLQLSQIGSIDGKVNFGLGSATLLTAATVALHNALDAALRDPVTKLPIAPRPIGLLGFTIQNPRPLIAWGSAIALLVYIGVVVFTFLAYRIRTFEVAGNPRTLMDKYLEQLDDRETKKDLAELMARNFVSNGKGIEAKVRWANWAMIFLGIEALVLLGLTYIQIQL